MIPQERYKTLYKEHASLEEESVLLEGIMQEAAQARGMGRIIPFAFFIQDSKKKDFIGLQGRHFLLMPLC